MKILKSIALRISCLYKLCLNTTSWVSIAGHLCHLELERESGHPQETPCTVLETFILRSMCATLPTESNIHTSIIEVSGMHENLTRTIYAMLEKLKRLSPILRQSTYTASILKDLLSRWWL